MNPVVTVDKGQPLAVRICEGPIDGGIPGGGQAAVFLMDHADAGILGGIFIANGTAVIRASVIYKNQFEVRKGLR